MLPPEDPFERMLQEAVAKATLPKRPPKARPSSIAPEQTAAKLAAVRHLLEDPTLDALRFKELCRQRGWDIEALRREVDSKMQRGRPR